MINLKNKAKELSEYFYKTAERLEENDLSTAEEIDIFNTYRDEIASMMRDTAAELERLAKQN